jgi:general secretion pathway protein F
VPVYAYTGVNAAGKSQKGFVDAENQRSARTKLRQDGVFITSLEEGEAPPQEKTRRGFALPSLRRIPGIDLAIATRQLATLVGAGVPLVGALAAQTQQVENARLKAVLGQVRDRVNEGATLADALAAAGPFSDLYVGLVRAGEAGGALETVLDRLADYLEGQVRLRNKVGSILVYPLVMFGVAMLVAGILVTVVLPQINELLESLNRPLPIYTRIIIATSTFMQDWWWAVLILATGIGFALRAAVRTDEGRLRYDRLRLGLPVFGRVVRQLAISRFSRTLSTLLAGGIPIVRALDIASHVANNRVLAEAIQSARESITRGAAVAKTLQASGEFPPLVTQLVDVGERSGELEAMLSKVADTYEEQVETTVTRLTALLEPLLVLMMVGLVVLIILATLVPLLEITSTLNQ